MKMNFIEYAKYLHSRIRDDVLQKLLDNESCALLGFPGSGKTFMTADIVRTLVLTHNKNVAIAGSTGSAAQQLKSLIPEIGIKAQTIHSLLGFGPKELHSIEKGQVEQLEREVRRQRAKGRYSLHPLTTCHVLVVEEVSMLTPEFVQAMDSTMRLARQTTTKKFGGVACLFVGDFRQLPPVSKSPNGYLFQHPKWSNSQWVDKVFCLEFILRQSGDPLFVEMILRLSHNASTTEDLKRFSECIVPQGFINIMKVDFLPEALRVFHTNSEVNRFNHNVTKAARSEGKDCRPLDVTWNIPENAANSVRETCCRQLEKDMVFSREIFLGARVIVTANMSMDHGVVNGTMGEVTSFRPPSDCEVGCSTADFAVELKLDDGNRVVIGSRSLSKELDSSTTVKGYYIPLLLSHALTVHRLQGSTVRRPLFYCPRKQGPYLREFYVIATRVISLDLLYLTHLPDSIMSGIIDPIVLDYYEKTINS